MLHIGTKVIATYPNHAAGIPGKLLRQETRGRWLVKFDHNPLGENKQPFCLSLTEFEFAVIDRRCLKALPISS